jgi:CBS domain-containing protein
MPQENAMKASDLMTRSPAVVTPNDSIVRAAELMQERDVGIIPVVDDAVNMKLVGVLTDRDIAVRCVARHHDATCAVRHHMTDTHLATVDADADVEDVLARMGEHRVRRIPVVSRGDHLEGIIAQADLAVKLGPKEPLRVEHLVEHISEPVAAVH